MARGVNKVILIGNLGQDPEVRFLPSGSPVANIRIATTDTWNDKQTGERQERTEWHSVVMFNKLAEIAQQYVKKGSRLYIEGRLQTRKWQDQSGQDRYSTEIVANDMQMLDSRQGQQDQGQQYQNQGQGQNQNQNQNQQSQAQGYGQQNQGQNQQNQNQNQGQGQGQNQNQPAQATQNHQPQNNGASSGGFDDFDDEIPF